MYVGVGSGRTEALHLAAGRLVTVCLARDIGNVESLLRADARPFIAAHLRDLFGERPARFHGIALQLAQLFNPRRCSALPGCPSGTLPDAVNDWHTCSSRHDCITVDPR